MAIVLRVPKRQVRVAVVGVAMIVLGASVAAQTMSPADPVPVERSPVVAVAPHDSALMEIEAAEPESRSSATHSRRPQPQQQPQQQSPPAQQGGQPPVPQGQTGAQQGGTGAQELLTPEEREALQLVERLIQEQEGVLMGTGFDYTPGGRRDPFRSLLAEITAVSAPTVRPFGLPGFLISEVELKAIASVQGRWHAMVIGPNQRAYFLEVGTELFDGHVMQIDAGLVVFEQVVPDFTGARRTRQVTKRLRTTDGGGETP